MFCCEMIAVPVPSYAVPENVHVAGVGYGQAHCHGHAELELEPLDEEDATGVVTPAFASTASA